MVDISKKSNQKLHKYSLWRKESNCSGVVTDTEDIKTYTDVYHCLTLIHDEDLGICYPSVFMNQ